MNWVIRKPSLGAGRFSKSMDGVCSVTVRAPWLRSEDCGNTLIGAVRTEPGVGDDLVVVAVHHQHWHRDLLEVLGEIGLGEGDDAA